jgi:hypothetical protein
MSEEGGWESNWQRPKEGEWKQAPDGTWYKDAGSQPKPAESQWAPPSGGWEQPQPPPQQPPAAQPQPQAQWPPAQGGPGTFIPPQPTSGKATGALILGIAGIFFCPLVCAILALVLGYQARSEIDRSGGRIGGRGQATAGIVLGWVGVGLVLLFVALVIIGLAVGDSTGSSTTEFQFN